jgi:alcohol dehydrogenase (NADP+)
VAKAVEHALAVGYRCVPRSPPGPRHLDCAGGYGNEAEVGEGIRASGVARAELFITSKLWNTKHHPEDVEAACRKSLADLGTDYLDLYLIHWPVAFQRGEDGFPRNEDGTIKYDTEIHPTTTWLAMEQLVGKGLVRSIGVSNFNSEQLADVLSKGSIKPVTNQVECHPYLAQSGLLAFCRERSIALTAYSPLGSPDRPWAQPGDPLLLQDPKVRAVADRHCKSPAQVLIRWQLQRGVIVIPKSVTPARIKENAEVFDFQLSQEEMAEIESFDRGSKGRMIVPMIDGKFRDGGHPHFPFHIHF